MHEPPKENFPGRPECFSGLSRFSEVRGEINKAVHREHRGGVTDA